MADKQHTNSMCSIYARLIRDQITSDSPDEETIVELTEYIERYCQTVGYEPGEVPEHLEEGGYLFDGQ